MFALSPHLEFLKGCSHLHKIYNAKGKTRNKEGHQDSN